MVSNSFAVLGDLSAIKFNTPSLLVILPANKAFGACRNTIATIESDTNSGTPGIGLSKAFRPSTSKLIKQIKKTMIQDPNRFATLVKRSRIFTKRPGNLARPIPLDFILYPSLSMALHPHFALKSYTMIVLRYLALPSSPILLPILWRHSSFPRPTWLSMCRLHRK